MYPSNWISDFSHFLNWNGLRFSTRLNENILFSDDFDFSSQKIFKLIILGNWNDNMDRKIKKRRKEKYKEKMVFWVGKNLYGGHKSLLYTLWLAFYLYKRIMLII